MPNREIASVRSRGQAGDQIGIGGWGGDTEGIPKLETNTPPRAPCRDRFLHDVPCVHACERRRARQIDRASPVLSHVVSRSSVRVTDPGNDLTMT